MTDRTIEQAVGKLAELIHELVWDAHMHERTSYQRAMELSTQAQSIARQFSQPEVNRDEG